MSMQDKIKWTPEVKCSQNEAFSTIKQILTRTETLAFPDYSKSFRQTVDCKGEYITSVLIVAISGNLWHIILKD